MKKIIQMHPITSSMALVFLCTISIRITEPIWAEQSHVQWILGIEAHHFFSGTTRLLLTVPTAIVLGIVIRKNGFRFSFSPKGSKKAWFASVFTCLFILFQFIHFINLSVRDLQIIPFIPTILFFDAANSIFEEVLFRGLFMTAMLLRFGDTVKGRVFCVFLSAVLFGGVHYSQGFMGAFSSFFIGFAWGAVYLYSKNLLVLMIVHYLWNIVGKITGAFYMGMWHSELWMQITAGTQSIFLFFVFIPFALYLCVKAEPFSGYFLSDWSNNLK